MRDCLYVQTTAPNNAAFAWWTDLNPSVHGGTVFTLEVDAAAASCSGTAADTTVTCSGLAADATCSGEAGCVLNPAPSEAFVAEWNSPVYGAASSANNAHFQIVLTSDGAAQFNYQLTVSYSLLYFTLQRRAFLRDCLWRQPFTAATWSPISVGVEGPVPSGPGQAQRGMSISYNQPDFPVGGHSVYFAPGCIG